MELEALARAVGWQVAERLEGQRAVAMPGAEEAMVVAPLAAVGTREAEAMAAGEPEEDTAEAVAVEDGMEGARGAGLRVEAEPQAGTRQCRRQDPGRRPTAGAADQGGSSQATGTGSGKCRRHW